MKKLLLLLFLPLTGFSQIFTENEIARWQAQASRVTIIEDNWGIPHIYGKADADAVFGLLYVQCQQNFSRIERNYLEMMGRLSEIEGEKTIYDDLQMRLIYDSAAAKKDYAASPQWFKNLLNAFADGINYFLYKHPEVKPMVLKKFEPWFPLLYTDGSIHPTQTGNLTVRDLKNFYESIDEPTSRLRPDLSINNFKTDGSNGFAIAPSKTAGKNAILYINPHVTFYFRTEVHMVSEEGLNAYGAVTWGQFFVYQGFNENCGWMHTSSYADVADVYENTVHKEDKEHRYEYGDTKRLVEKKQISIHYKNGNSLSAKTFPAYFTIHGPVMGRHNDKWLSLKENNRSLSALQQSWLRTKAKGFEEFKKIMDMRSNNSNNTVFADNKGNIAYWHGNFVPKRNPKFDWTLPVDGADPETSWKGIHTLEETIHLYNPANGWIQNCNSTPFTAAGSSSPDPKRYPAYMAHEGQNGRALNAQRLLSNASNITLNKIIEIGYDTYLTAFDILLPVLFKAYRESKQDSLKQELKESIHLLQTWNKRSLKNSVATTIAVEWATRLAGKIPPAKTPEAATNAIGNFNRMASLPANELLKNLQETIHDLKKRYGNQLVSWGEVNRYQRSNNNEFSDSDSSMAVGLAPGTWGCLPSFVSRRMNTNKRYGVSGNSFVAAVEFGKRIKAKTILTGGESFDPSSENYTDQAQGFIDGQFKDIYFYKEDVLKKAKRSYHPGQ